MHKHGLAVMRCQPLHNGHKRIMDQMLKECEMITVVLGSIDKRDKRNPFPFHERKKMIKNIYNQPEKGIDSWSQQITVIGVPDINDDLGWARYILRSVEDHYIDNLDLEDFPKPDAYYTGSEFDARWYRDQKMETKLVPRIDPTFPVTSATIVRDLCEYGDPRWRDYVPVENHELIEKWVSKIQFLTHEARN